MEEIENRRPERSSLIWKVAVIVLLALVGVAAGFFFGLKKNVSDKAAAFESVEVIPAVLDSIVGNYEVKFVSGDSTLALTGYIDVDSLGCGVLHVLSSYEPQIFSLGITADGKIVNDELGEGTISYRPAIDATVITFTKEDTICELRR